eukprot:SAG31_NODE_46517_length_254_cov_0.664516_1_plen_52_part_10
MRRQQRVDHMPIKVFSDKIVDELLASAENDENTSSQIYTSKRSLGRSGLSEI